MDGYFEKLFQGLKSYVSSKSIYAPYISKKAKESIFPLVVLSVSNNTNIANLGFYEQIDMLSLTVEISTINLEFDGGMVDAMIVANELHKLVNEYMGVMCGLKRTYDSPTPNVDKNVYRIVMRYTVKINRTKNMIY